MKKMSFCLILLMTTSSAVFSQVHFGIDPGIAVSKGKYTPANGLDVRVYAGFDGGVFLEHRVVPGFVIRPEVNYSMIGTELNDGSKEATIKFRYIDLALLGKFNIAKIGLFAGPQIGFLTSANRDSSFTDEHIDMKKDFRGQDYGLVIGAEYRFTRHFSLSARYYHGMQQAAKDWNNFELRNRFGSVRIGYQF